MCPGCICEECEYEGFEEENDGIAESFGKNPKGKKRNGRTRRCDIHHGDR